MGGQAFLKPGKNGEPALNIPRMSSSTYKHLRDEYLQKAAGLYAKVICPREAPEKVDHGDIDILVSTMLPSASEADLQATFNASRTFNNGEVRSFAIPCAVPGETCPTHAQLDIHTCGDNIDWLAFMHAYGDVWTILGALIRDSGFTPTNKGLHVRLAELEATDRKASMIWLSKDPSDIMQFLGLDAKIYDNGFGTEQQLFEWITGCRLMKKTPFRAKSHTVSDRGRQKRGMFQRFFETYLPSLESEHGDTDDSDSISNDTQRPNPALMNQRPPLPEQRNELLAQAVTFFGKEDEYSKAARHARYTLDEEQARLLLVAVLESTGQSVSNINLIIRGVKRWVAVAPTASSNVSSDATPPMPFEGAPNAPLALTFRLQPEMDTAAQIHLGTLLGEDREVLREEVVAWIQEHWQELKDAERRRAERAKETRAAHRTF